MNQRKAKMLRRAIYQSKEGRELGARIDYVAAKAGGHFRARAPFLRHTYRAAKRAYAAGKMQSGAVVG